MKLHQKIVWGILIILLIVPWVNATLQQTTFTWVTNSSKGISITYGGSCSTTAFFFSEADALFDPDVDGNAAKVVPSPSVGGTACQSSSVAPMFIRNVGTASINVDGNFSSAFTGVDLNIVLKVWRGTGSGCGSKGFGGWQKDCTVTTSTSPVTTTTCRNFNRFNATTAGRLISSLSAGDTNQLCYSGDFNGFVGAGTHTGTFQTGTN